jgi:hypothetical protein
MTVPEKGLGGERGTCPCVLYWRGSGGFAEGGSMPSCEETDAVPRHRLLRTSKVRLCLVCVVRWPSGFSSNDERIPSLSGSQYACSMVWRTLCRRGVCDCSVRERQRQRHILKSALRSSASEGRRRERVWTLDGDMMSRKFLMVRSYFRYDCKVMNLMI